MVTAIELNQQTGASIDSIRGKFRRKGYSKFRRNQELPQAFVQWFIDDLNGVKPSVNNQEQVTDNPEPDPTQSHQPDNSDANSKQPERETKPNERPPDEPPTQPDPTSKQPEETTEPTRQTEQFDLGDILLFHPTAKFAYVFTLILGQAWIFASLSERVYADQANHLPFASMMVYGLLIEFGGIMLSKVFGKGSRDAEFGNLWLFVFLVWQCAVDLSYFGLLGSHSDLIGKYIIAGSLPLGILAYSVNYFNKQHE